MNEIIVNILLVIGGATGQFILSAFIIPKKDKRESDQQFIDTLIERIGHLEGKIDILSTQLNEVMRENERLKVEMSHLTKKNDK